MNNPLVSILIPVYNRELLIGETIKSAIAQTYKNIEVIIVDNNSSDNTWKNILEYKKIDNRIKVFKNKENVGPVRNWKRCIDEASGEYAKILWSDDMIAPEFLERTLPFLVSSPDVGFVFTGTEIFEDNDDLKIDQYFIGKTGIYDSNSYINGVLFGSNYPVSPGCSLFRMRDLRENLLVDIPNKVGSNFPMHAIGNDLLIYLLTANKYKKFGFVNGKLSFFRAHKDSISIQSENGKLQLHYNLAASYFIENYRVDLIKRMNTNIVINIKRYHDVARKFHLDKVEKFYLKNKNYSIGFHYFIIKACKAMTRRCFCSIRVVLDYWKELRNKALH